MQRLGLVLVLAAACGGRVDLPLDDDATTGDGGPDAPTDAAIDAAIDGPPPAPFSGEMSIVEAEVLLANAPAPYGQGLEVRIAFTENAMVPAPLLEEQAGPLGCKVREYTPVQAAYAAAGYGEGAVFLRFEGGSNPAIPPVVPSCRFTAGPGYHCDDFTTSSSGGNLTAGAAAGTAVLTDVDINYDAGNSLGRWLRLEGAAMAGNNGVFPIVGVVGPHAIAYANPGWTAELLPGGAVHVNLAGVGPIPGVGDPGFLADDAALTIIHAGGGPGHIPAFQITTAGPGHVGDDFTLDPSSRALLTHIPRDGSALMFTCASGCGADAADATLVRILTTDAPVAGRSPVAMPPPMTRQVEIRCLQLGGDPITVPAAYSARLMTAGATRIEARVVRGAALSFAPPPVTALAGHALVGITTF